jgi:fructokinase
VTRQSREKDIDVLAVGETVVDFISSRTVGTLEEADQFGRYLGGSVTNVALNMVRLGGRAAVASRVGDDPFGQFSRRKMDREGIITDYVQIDRETRTTLAFVTRGKDTADFVIYRGSDAHLSTGSLSAEAIDRTRAVHTSAFALSREPARAAVLRTLRAAREKGCLVSLDPNYDPRIDPDVEDFQEVLKEAFQFVMVTKPSRDDCARLFGPDLPPEDCIERFLGWGAEIVALTMGASGVMLATAEGDRFRIWSGRTNVIDTTGAGDAFWAGLLTGLLEEFSPQKAARLGQAAAEAKIGRVGHLPPTIDRASLYGEMDSVLAERR